MAVRLIPFWARSGLHSVWSRLLAGGCAACAGSADHILWAVARGHARYTGRCCCGPSPGGAGDGAGAGCES